MLTLLLGGIAAGVTISGIANAGDGMAKNAEAQKLNKEAEELSNEYKEYLKDKIKESLYALNDLGNAKLKFTGEQLANFVVLFKNITMKPFISPVLGMYDIPQINSDDIPQIESVSLKASDMLKIGTLGTLGGAVICWGTYAVTAGLLGYTASGGLIATNATMATLGGGSLAAGGFGMVGGTVVLSAIATAPLIAIGGLLYKKKAEENLEKAKQNLEKAQLFVEQCNTAITALDGIIRVAKLYEDFIKQMTAWSEYILDRMACVIMKYGTDTNLYSDDTIKILYATIELMSTVKKVLEQNSLLDEQGNLSQGTENDIQNIFTVTGNVFNNHKLQKSLNSI